MTTQNYKQKIITHLTESPKIVHFIEFLFLWILHSIKCKVFLIHDAEQNIKYYWAVERSTCTGVANENSGG